jgi:hypothetical protein
MFSRPCSSMIGEAADRRDGWWFEGSLLTGID